MNEIRKEVTLKNNQDYLKMYEYLEEVLDGKTEDEIEELRKAYSYAALYNIRYLPLIQYPIQEFHKDHSYDKVSPLRMRGYVLSGEEVMGVFSFYTMKKDRAKGKTWNEIIETYVYQDDDIRADNFIRLMEIETGEDISSTDTVLEYARIDPQHTDPEILEGYKSIFPESMKRRLEKRMYEIIDEGGIWEDLTKEELSGFFYTYISPSFGDRYKTYEDFLLQMIGIYFTHLEIESVSVKPKYITKLLQAPREIEFKLKEKFKFYKSTDLDNIEVPTENV